MDNILIIEMLFYILIFNYIYFFIKALMVNYNAFVDIQHNPEISKEDKKINVKVYWKNNLIITIFILILICCIKLVYFIFNKIKK